jgi:predicted enzyme related to lactoylglutathione lyase
MLGLRTVGYEVSNLATAVEWYSNAFGVKPYIESPEYVGFNIQGYELGLMPESDSPIKGNNVLAYWGVENIDIEVSRLFKLGAEIHTPIIEVGGGIRLCTLKDPFGNILGIIVNPIFTLE